jgi:hypothetical protein
MKWNKNKLDSINKKAKIKAGGKKPMSTGYVNGLKQNNKGIYIYRVMVNGKVRTGTTNETVLFKAEIIQG